jgi:hypothetical protein
MERATIRVIRQPVFAAPHEWRSVLTTRLSAGHRRQATDGQVTARRRHRDHRPLLRLPNQLSPHSDSLARRRRPQVPRHGEGRTASGCTSYRQSPAAPRQIRYCARGECPGKGDTGKSGSFLICAPRCRAKAPITTSTSLLLICQCSSASANGARTRSHRRVRAPLGRFGRWNPRRR